MAEVTPPVLWDIEARHVAQLGQSPPYAEDGIESDGLVGAFEWESRIDLTIDFGGQPRSRGHSDIVMELKDDVVTIDFDIFYVGAVDDSPGHISGYQNLLTYVPYAPLGDELKVTTTYTFLEAESFNNNGNEGSATQVTSTTIGIAVVDVDGTPYARNLLARSNSIDFFQLLATHFNGTPDTVLRGQIVVTAENLSVPEPASLSFLGCGLMLLARRRSR